MAQRRIVLFLLVPGTVVGRHYDQQSTVPVFVTYHAENPT